MSFFNRKGEVIVTEMARILTRIKEAEENNQKKEEQVKAELAQYEQLKNPCNTNGCHLPICNIYR